MKIRSLALENFRRFRAPVRIEGLSDGLNLISEPNETGKSTILEAMRAALFERHGSAGAFIKSLRPWGDETAPTVELCFELDGTAWTVAKRFLQKPQVTLTGPGGQVFTSDAAEEKLQVLLGFERSSNRGADDESRGILGLLWVEQGAALSLGAPGRIARETIQSVLAGEVGAVTGGKRAFAVTAAVETALADFRTAKSGQATGKLLAAQQRLSLAQIQHTEAQASMAHFAGVLDRLALARAELDRTERLAADPVQAEDVKTWTRDLEVAKAAEGRRREAEARLGEAQSRRQQVEARATARLALALQAETAAKASAEAAAHLVEFEPVLSAAVKAEGDRAEDLKAARAALEAADQTAATALAAERAASRTRHLVAAFARLDAAERLAKDIDGLREDLSSSTVTASILQTLQDLSGQVGQTQAALEAGAPTLDVTLRPGAAGKARFNGAAATEGRHLIVAPATLDIADVGAFRVSPASSVAAQAAHRRATEDLGAALDRAGVASLDAARAAADQRRAAADRLKELEIRLETLCAADTGLDLEAGLDALRGALAGVDRPPTPPQAAGGPPDISGDAEGAAVRARMTERAAAEARDAAGEALKAAELRGQTLSAASRDLKVRQDQLAAELASARTAQPDADLDAELLSARQAEARAQGEVEEMKATALAFSVEELERKLANAGTRRRNIEAERVRLAGEIGGLAEAARSEGERGPAADLEIAREAEDSAASDLALITEQAEVLTLLRSVLADASREATRQYLGPVTQRVAPYIGRLLPGATLELSDAMAAGSVSRSGRLEPAEDLSRGTQEQLAVLTRIAFADLLLEKGRPVSLVLDDALVYSDDGRLETMTDILSEVAGRMQVIILTCRKRAFLHLEANRVSLVEV
ncbi:AAA family ATPase [Phenylobacterium aquaticum]|uniref:AAA family ATPase n=1 Tax=Phenylobacterium aquaticum TaxID=1763816 RepID=UPI001F5C46A0|nr:AAA family ATPase [Phenylobacterium aquaticum]MCI3132054.1 AAA family ATPase [Phenylobacterium aquaticum]